MICSPIHSCTKGVFSITLPQSLTQTHTDATEKSRTQRRADETRHMNLQSREKRGTCKLSHHVSGSEMKYESVRLLTLSAMSNT